MEKVKLNEYETVFITRPEIADDQLEKVRARVVGVIDGRGGKLLKYANWGKKKLAYDIAKNNKGIYFHMVYLGDNALAKELERNLKLLEPVIRYLTVNLADDVDPDSRTAALEEVREVKAGGGDEAAPALSRPAGQEDEEHPRGDEDDEDEPADDDA